MLREKFLSPDTQASCQRVVWESHLGRAGVERTFTGEEPRAKPKQLTKRINLCLTLPPLPAVFILQGKSVITITARSAF